MSSYSITEPSAKQKSFAAFLVILYALITITPLIWIIATGFKSSADSIAYPPKVFFEPHLDGYVNLFTTRTRINSADLATLPPPQTWYEQVARDNWFRLDNSLGLPWNFSGLCFQPLQGSA
jgi:multiple sugar transport system permease protein